MNLLHIVLSIALILAILYVFVGYTEGFALKPQEYPCGVDTVNLYGDYPVKTTPTLSQNSYSENSKMESYTEMSSYEQTTNNVQNWTTPDNGTCSPAEFCGALYNKKVFDLVKATPPNDSEGTRVNYYVSD